MRRAVLVFLFCGTASAWAAGAPTGSLLGKHDTDQPIVITADNTDADLNKKTVTYTGNVIVVQGDIHMHANSLKDDSIAKKLFADGKVVVDSPVSGTATGDNAVYDEASRIVTLTGHVVLTHGKADTARGTHGVLTVNLITGIAHFTNPGGRVQSVITPPPSSNQPAGAAGSSGN